MADSWDNQFYSLTISSGGYLFYGQDAAVSGASVIISSQLTVVTIKTAKATCSAESSCQLSASLTKVKNVSSTTTVESLLSSDSTKVAHASSSIEGLSIAAIVSLEELRAKSGISVGSSLSVSTEKISYASSSVEGLSVSAILSLEEVYAKSSLTVESSLNVSTDKVALTSLDTSGESSVSCDSIEIAYASSSIEGLSITAIISLEESYARASLNIESSVSASAEEIVYASISISGNSYDSSDVYDSSYPYNAALAASVVVIGRKLIEAAAQISGELSTSVSSIRTGVVSADLSIEGAVLTLSEEILYPEISISASSQVIVSMLKFAYSSTATSADSSVDVSSIKIAIAGSDVSIDSNLSAAVLAIEHAAAVLDGTAFNVIVGKKILLARASISVLSSRLFVSPLRFSESVIEDTQSIRNLIVLDNKPLTEQNRTFSSNVDTQYVENINWNSLKSRYYKSNGIKRTFSISWSYIPNNRENTVDFKFGRDMIKSIANDPDIHTMKYLNIDSDGTTPRTEDEYEVIVKSYSEKLVRRDLSSDVYFWDCNLELEEV